MGKQQKKMQRRFSIKFAMIIMLRATIIVQCTKISGMFPRHQITKIAVVLKMVKRCCIISVWANFCTNIHLPEETEKLGVQHPVGLCGQA
jgi:hypothetical protein